MPPRKPRPLSVAITGPSTDGRYHGFLTVGTKPNGRPDRRHRSGATYDEVEDKIRTLEDEYAGGRVAKAGRVPTVQAWFETWLGTIAPLPQGKRDALSPKTLQAYWSVCRNWVFPHVGHLRLDSLEPEHLEILYAAMYDAGRAPGYVGQAHAVIRRGLKIAVRRGKATRNVTMMMDSPGASDTEIRALTKVEIAAVLDVVRHRPDAARWILRFAIGARQGEVLGLRWQYVDLAAGTAEIAWQLQRLPWRHGCGDAQVCGERFHYFDTCPRTGPQHERHRRGTGGKRRDPNAPCPKPCRKGCAQHAKMCPERTGGGLVFRRPKGRETRIVALPGQLVALLKDVRAQQIRDRLAYGAEWQDNDVVFPGPLGRLVDPGQDRDSWLEIIAAAGVGHARLHAMRHTAATMLIAMGEDIRVVQEILGHVNIATTQRYVDVGAEMTKQAASKMDDALFGGSATTAATRINGG